MRYTLMHKQIAVADIELNEDTGLIQKINTVYAHKHLPVGVTIHKNITSRAALNEWWEDRSIPLSRFGINEVLKSLDISNTKVLLPRCYGLSLSDQYWICPKEANLTWKQINFFDNTFSNDIGDILFGEQKKAKLFDFKSPDITTNGDLKKSWKSINGKLCLIKGGSGPFQQQPFNESIATGIMERLAIPHVPYTVIWNNKIPYCVCEDFVKPNTELVSAWHIMKMQKKANDTSIYQHFINCCEMLGVKDVISFLDHMIVLDYIIANEDRHLNNFGLLRNSETLEWLGMAPIYDSGSSLGYDKTTAQIHATHNETCKPFKKYHTEQLKLVSSFDWIDFDRLSDVADLINETLSQNNAKDYIDESRINAISYTTQKRIQNLYNLVMAHKPYKKMPGTDDTESKTLYFMHRHNSIENMNFCSKEFIAHIRKDKDINSKEINVIQTISEHCKNTAKYCSTTAKTLGLENFGYYIGIMHDAGKFSDEFQEYILKAANGENVHRGSVNHTFAAAAYTLKKFHVEDIYQKLAAEFAAFTIGSHHGLFDINSLEKKNGFEHRLNYINDNNIYELSMQRFFENCISEDKLCDIFSHAYSEIKEFHNKIFLFCKEMPFTKKEAGKTSYSFFLGMTARILLSSLVDADRNDTYKFMNNKDNSKKHVPDKKFWQKQSEYIEKRLNEFACNSKINQIRRNISDEAAEFAKNMPDGGIFRLNVPTGAGKTLTSFRLAISAAVNKNVSRIIYVLPLLSIIDQNAKIIKEYSYDKNSVTEHHSNIIKEDMTKDELDEYELICENWSNAVIVTTLVQFLNTLFSGKTQAVRRMKALINSVIIIDEVQTVPLKMLHMFNNALNFLAYCCHCKIILCSATQPCFEKTDYMLKYSDNCDIVKINKQIEETFKRTKIIDKTDTSMSVEGLCDFSMEVIKSSENLLIICNTKSTAENIFKEIEIMSADEYKVFCLTANMCMKHRQLILRMINYFLKKHQKIICVSTQLVEAGVDFSFETLIRVRAGLDNIAQAAGRCNRSFDYGHICNVYMVRLNDEKLSYLKDIQNSQNSTMDFLYKYNQNPESYDNDILSEKSIEKYYSLLFSNSDVKNNFSYPVKKPQDTNIFNLLALNNSFSDNDNKYFLKQAFKTAGELFEVFDSESFDVIVPYNKKAKELIADLNSEKAKFDIAFVKNVVQKAKPYMVSLFKYQLDKLVQDGMLEPYDNGHIYTLNESCYNRKTGLEIVHNDIY